VEVGDRVRERGGGGQRRGGKKKKKDGHAPKDEAKASIPLSSHPFSLTKVGPLVKQVGRQLARQEEAEVDCEWEERGEERE
jgi:hypothetical protein